MLTLIGLIVLFTIYGFVRMKSRKEFLVDVPKKEVNKGLMIYVGVYAGGIYLAYTISDFLSKKIADGTMQFVFLIVTIIAVIIVIIQILNRVLSEQLKKVFL